MSETRNCPNINVDIVVFNEKAELLLIRRAKEPFLGAYAFPGGHVEIGETTEECSARELFEETNIEIDPTQLHLVGVYSDPKRDPRKHCIGISYLGFVQGQTPKPATDAKTATFKKDYLSLEMAFDHARILKDALKKAKELNPSLFDSSVLMGDVVEPRRDFIQQNALKVPNLDV